MIDEIPIRMTSSCACDSVGGLVDHHLALRRATEGVCLCVCTVMLLCFGCQLATPRCLNLGTLDFFGANKKGGDVGNTRHLPPISPHIHTERHHSPCLRPHQNYTQSQTLLEPEVWRFLKLWPKTSASVARWGLFSKADIIAFHSSCFLICLSFVGRLSERVNEVLNSLTDCINSVIVFNSALFSAHARHLISEHVLQSFFRRCIRIGRIIIFPDFRVDNKFVLIHYRL